MKSTELIATLENLTSGKKPALEIFSTDHAVYTWMTDTKKATPKVIEAVRKHYYPVAEGGAPTIPTAEKPLPVWRFPAPKKTPWVNKNKGTNGDKVVIAVKGDGTGYTDTLSMPPMMAGILKGHPAFQAPEVQEFLDSVIAAMKG